MKPEYTPILKLREAEIGALRELSENRKNAVLPLLEVVWPKIGGSSKSDKRPGIASARKITRFNKEVVPSLPFTIVEAWANRPAIIDFSRINNTESKIKGLGSAMKSMDHQNLWGQTPQLTVAVGLSEHKDYLGAVASATSRNTTTPKVCLRIKLGDLTDIHHFTKKVSYLLQSLNTGVHESYMLIDLEKIVSSASYGVALNALKSLHDLGEPAGSIISGSSLTSDLSHVDFCSLKTEKRSEWAAWLNCRNKLMPIPPIIFSDYGTRYPGDDYGAMNSKPTPYIIYTMRDRFLIIRGKRGDSGQFPRLANELVRLGAIYNSNFSSGDKFITNKANRPLNSGGPGQWIRASLNHHMSDTVDEIAKLRVAPIATSPKVHRTPKSP